MAAEGRYEARNDLSEQLQDAGEIPIEEKRRLIRAWLAGYWTAHGEVSALFAVTKARRRREHHGAAPQ